MPERYAPLCTCISGMHQDNPTLDIISPAINFTFSKPVAFIIPYIPCALINVYSEKNTGFKIRRPRCESWLCSSLTLGPQTYCACLSAFTSVKRGLHYFMGLLWFMIELRSTATGHSCLWNVIHLCDLLANSSLTFTVLLSCPLFWEVASSTPSFLALQFNSLHC